MIAKRKKQREKKKDERPINIGDLCYFVARQRTGTEKERERMYTLQQLSGMNMNEESVIINEVYV